MRILFILLFVFVGVVTQQPPCASILESAIYKSIYIAKGGAGSSRSAYDTFLSAVCSLPRTLPLPLTGSPDVLAAFEVAASALMANTASSESVWEYPGSDYSASNFLTSQIYRMVSNFNRAVCNPEVTVSGSAICMYNLDSNQA